MKMVDGKKKDLILFAKKHNLKIGIIEELIKYRISNEKRFKELANKLSRLNMVLSHQSFIGFLHRMCTLL